MLIWTTRFTRKKAALAVVVLGDPLASDVWIEDASVASIILQLQAEKQEQ